MFLLTFSCDNVVIAPAAINGPLDKLKTYRLVVIVVVVAVVLVTTAASAIAVVISYYSFQNYLQSIPKNLKQL